MPLDQPVVTPNLLDPVPFARVDEEELRQALVFAFATGDVGDALAQIVDRMTLAASSWQPKDFAGEVFLDVLAERCFPVVVDGKAFPRSKALLGRILGSPPRDPAVVVYRQTISGELDREPALRAATERLYKELFHLRALLTRTTATRTDPFERRLATLRTIRDTVKVASLLKGARSGLGTVGQWGLEMTRSSEYSRLLDLLAYEEGSAEVLVQLRLGFDGKVRALQVVEHKDHTESSFHMGGASLFAAKLGLFVRGYDFSVHELFARLCDEVFEGLVGPLLPMIPLMGDLEFHLAGLGFRDLSRARGLSVSLPTVGQSCPHAYEGLFNPLLLTEGTRVVPCDLATQASDARVIVTGPNSGGKTRLLQAIAIAQILAQAGTFVPARSAKLAWARGLFVSLIEHARADQREGRLGTELLRIRRLFETLQSGSLVILDELCSGTNPSEGEEIFRLVVKLLGELRPLTFVTTHFLAFARRLAEEPGSLEFLQVELAGEEPTYKFVPGVATSSLAQKTALRLGVTEEALRALIARNNPELSTRAKLAPETTPEGRRDREADRERKVVHRPGDFS
jgi:DNA mismatch repair protein MutS2